jgi:hypothetical protein
MYHFRETLNFCCFKNGWLVPWRTRCRMAFQNFYESCFQMNMPEFHSHQCWPVCSNDHWHRERIADSCETLNFRSCNGWFLGEEHVEWPFKTWRNPFSHGHARIPRTRRSPICSQRSMTSRKDCGQDLLERQSLAEFVLRYFTCGREGS